jgi:ornithine cyclodeaminase
MIFVSDQQVQDHVTWADLLPAIEDSFIGLSRAESTVFDVVRAVGGGPGHFFAIKSGRDGRIPMLGLKAGSYAPANQVLGLQAHTSTTLLIDDSTGRPIAMVEANYLNGMRTASADALAVRELARPDASVVALIGAGDQAVFEAQAIAQVRKLRRILVASRTAAGAQRCARRLGETVDATVECVDPEAAARQADIIVTVTPAITPVLMDEWVQPGTHISAMGADNVGKQELELPIFLRANTFVDYPAQAAEIGECQHAVAAGILSCKQLEQSTLGALLARKIAGRKTADEVTLFDSSGIALQDIAAAYCAVKCVERAARA